MVADRRAYRRTASSTTRRGWGRRLAPRAAVGMVLLLGALCVAAHATTDRYAVSRAIAWLEADVGDIRRFPARAIPAEGDVLPLPPGKPVDVGAIWGEDDLKVFMGQTATAALLVVQDGALRLEEYALGTKPTTLRTSFSTAKSVVSTLVGLAIADGLIDSVDEPITNSVPELERRDPRFSAITIRHLLTMSSGLRYEERGLPWSDDAITYYAPDLRAAALDAQIAQPPGQAFIYNNYNLLLEGLVLERATGMTVAQYASEKLWRPMGAEADASWSLDSTGSGFEKMESGLNAVPRDYARFGLLFARHGRVNGREVVPRQWIKQAVTPSIAGGPASDYGLHWWTADPHDRRPLPHGHFLAAGNHGQYVYVAPDKDLVIVRLGDDFGPGRWPQRLARLAQFL